MLRPCSKPVLVMQLAGALLEEYGPDVEITVKKPSTTPSNHFQIVARDDCRVCRCPRRLVGAVYPIVHFDRLLRKRELLCKLAHVATRTAHHDPNVNERFGT